MAKSASREWSGPRPTPEAVQTPPYGFRVPQQNASVQADPWSSGAKRYYDNKWLTQRLGAIMRDPLSIVTNLVRHAAGKPKRFKPDSVVLEIRTEQEPNPESRVTLSNEKDPFGQRRAHLHWTLSERDKRTMRVAAEVFGAELRRLNLGALNLADWLLSSELVFPPDMVGGHHHMGTTRMSADRRMGVVDADCKAHGLDNLYIAGTSVFSTAGYVNPTGTLLALAFRLAEHLEAKHERTSSARSLGAFVA
jgi:choline dehydrogenase-like flavoprotein